MYRDTGHALHWERPEEFVRDLEAFISTDADVTVTHTPAPGASTHTFDLAVDGAPRGYLEYSLPDAGTMVVHFVEVDAPLRGTGMGERLVAAAVAWARANSRRIVPHCSYARSVLTRTPEYQDVLK